MPSLNDYLDPAQCPRDKPSLELFSAESRALHDAVDSSIRAHGVAYLHPSDPTLQLDMLGSRHMADWQERKVEYVFGGERCWSDLHQFYARYGVEAARPLIHRVRELEGACGVVLTDCGMQAVALTLDVLAVPGGHAILMRAVYNKTRRYLEWLSQRLDLELTLVDGVGPQAFAPHIRPDTFVIVGETYSNPLMRALDPAALGAMVAEARAGEAKRVRLVLDNTIASPWGVRRPLLEHDGVDVVVASGTKALGGQDRDLWGYIAAGRADFLNEVMDLQAMRGGGLDWRRAQAILAGLDEARTRFEQRCATATRVARFLAAHPRIERVEHPSLPHHPDRAAIDAHYQRPGSLLAFRVRDADEEASRHFADVLATCVLPRYAGSFDGLTTKVNHHRTVSEYFTDPTELVQAGIDRFIRLGVGLEAPEDLEACLNWALWHATDVPEEEVLAWQRGREVELGLRHQR